MGQVAFDRSREDPELVRSANMCVNESVLHFSKFVTQAAHTEDSRASIDGFLTLADPSFGSISDKIVVTTIYNIVRKSLSRHGTRATSAEVRVLWYTGMHIQSVLIMHAHMYIVNYYVQYYSLLSCRHESHFTLTLYMQIMELWLEY